MRQIKKQQIIKRSKRGTGNDILGYAFSGLISSCVGIASHLKNESLVVILAGILVVTLAGLIIWNGKKR